MHAFHQGIGGDRQLFAGWRRQQGAVVADAEGHLRRRRRAGGRGEEAADQLELTQLTPPARDQRLPPRSSAARRRGASLSSTPLTNLWPSVAPKVLASSMPSLITTL